MGFLLGAFGKLQAGRRARDLQARLMRVSTQHRRAQRQVAEMTKALNNQKQAETNAMNMYTQWLKMGVQSQLQATFPAMGGNNGTAMTEEQQQQFSQYQYALQMGNARAEMMTSMMKQQIEEKYETMNDMMLEPLKMEEESLAMEKDSLETQLKIAEADYKACKEMEAADAKNLAPNYTGGGQG